MARSFRRGDPVTVVSGRFAGHAGVVESLVHQKSVDQPNESSPACHVILDTGKLVTLGMDHLTPCRAAAADDGPGGSVVDRPA